MERKLIDKILKLKKKRNATILAHYYQPDSIQKIADYVGDSYYLSQKSRDCKENIIVFCGVKFMGESAKILSPKKTILMPEMNAGCTMADMVVVDDLIEMRRKYPNATVVCYINSTYEVKAYCDVAVTSSSAFKIINNISNEEILFLPDKNLGEYISESFKNKKFILWDGFCKCHNQISREDILELKEENRDAKILVHPECKKEVRILADYIGSTSGIIDYASKDTANEFIIATEEGILYELNMRNPNKKFILPRKKISCKDMKKVTLEKVYDSLINMKNEVILNEEVSKKAMKCLENMHKLVEV